MVADALEVAVDLQDADEEPQVDGDRLLQGEQRDRRLLDRHLHPVDLVVGGDDAARLLRVHLGQGLDRAVDLPLDLSAHQDQLAAEVLELLGKMLFHDALLLGRSVQFQRASAERISRSFWWTASSRSDRHRPQRHVAVEDALEEVRLLARGVELRLAVGRARSPRARTAATGRGTRRPVTICRWLRSRPSAMRRIAASFSTTAWRYGSSRRQFSCVGFGPPALVVPGERREDLDLVGREPGQVAVRDQVVRVALVLGVADVAADVVQQRAVLQPLALGRRELVERVRLVEDLEGQPRDVRRVEDLGVAPPQQTIDAPGPHVPVDRDPRLAVAGDVVEQESLRAGPARRRRSRRRPARFRIQASRMPPGTAMSRRRGSRPGTRSFSFSVVRRRSRLTFFSAERESASDGRSGWAPGRGSAASWTSDSDWIVPEEPTHVLKPFLRTACAARLATARIAFFIVPDVPVGGRVALRENRSASRTTPSGRLSVSRTREPFETTNSVEPPPMSTRKRGSLRGRELAAHGEVDQPRLLLARDHVDAQRRSAS